MASLTTDHSHTDLFFTTYPLQCNSELTILNNIVPHDKHEEIFNSLLNLPWNVSLADGSAKPKFDTLWVGKGIYKYANITHEEFSIKNEALDYLFNQVNSIRNYKFDCVLINRYKGDNYVPAHKDSEYQLDLNHDILGVRLGQTRPLEILDNSKKLAKSIDIPSGNGFILTRQLQSNYFHQVPISSNKEGFTITLTFRKYQSVPTSSTSTIGSDSHFDYSKELSKVKNLTSLTDLLLHITEKLNNVEGNVAFDAIRPYLLNQFNIITEELHTKFLAGQTLLEEKIDISNEKLSLSFKRISDENKDLKNEINELNKNAEIQEQYSKRWNMLIMDIPEEKNEDLDEKIQNILSKIKSDIKLYDIERIHRIGNPKVKYTRPIVLRFANYRNKQGFTKNIISYNSANRDKSHNIIIREHLTKERLSLFKEALKLRYNKKIFSCHTSDGILKIKVKSTDKDYTYVKSTDDLYRTVPR